MFTLRLLVSLVGGWWRVRTRARTARLRCFRAAWGVLCRAYQAAHGSNVSLRAEFAGQPCFPHGMYGVFISGDAKIGRNCVVFHHVTIGSNTLPDSGGLGAPQIGDNCYIGAGAKVIGGVRVGNNVRIGANCVVHRDVPDNCVVVSGRQRIIPKEGLVNRYYSLAERWVYYDDGKWVPETDPQVLRALSEKLHA